jgi:hypothetical protein
MSPGAPKSPRPADGGGRLTTNPAPVAKSMRTSTLALLVIVVVVIAATMLASAVRFVVAPDPAVKAGPMYVVLALLTIASLLMALLALNASFFRILDRRRTADVSLVMWTMTATGLVTGLLTLGGAVNSLMVRMALASIAYAFLWLQASRISRARTAHAAAQPAGETTRPVSASRPSRPTVKSRQRRGGRRH